MPGELKSDPLDDKPSKAWVDLERYARGFCRLIYLSFCAGLYILRLVDEDLGIRPSWE